MALPLRWLVKLVDNLEAQIQSLKKYLSSKKNYIFDFDGVLVDSVEIKTEAFAYLYSAYGNEVVNKVVEFHRDNGGMSRYKKIEYFHEQLLGESISKADMNVLDKKFSEYVVNSVINAPEILGAEKLLKKLSSTNQCAVCSATPDKEIKTIVSSRGWNDYFNYVFGSPDSKTDNINKVLAQSGMTKEDSIFFGDAYADYEAAKSCNIDFIGVGNLWNDTDMNIDIVASVPNLMVFV